MDLQFRRCCVEETCGDNCQTIFNCMFMRHQKLLKAATTLSYKKISGFFMLSGGLRETLD